MQKFTQVNFIYSYKEEFMLYKKTGTIHNPQYIPIKGKENILREVSRAIAEINMSEIKAEEKIEPYELVHTVLDEMLVILAERVWNNLPE